MDTDWEQVAGENVNAARGTDGMRETSGTIPQFEVSTMILNSPRTRYSKLQFAILLASVLYAGTGPASAASKRDAVQEEVAANPIAGTPVMAIVSLASQRVTLYDAHGGALRAPVSSGQTEYETPVGIFAVLQKEEEHYSNLYDDASMPFMQRITWSGIALHAGQLPGYPASHGCVRMPLSFAERIFPMTRMGMRVIVARDDVAPVAIKHQLLFKPKPVGREEVAVATHTAYSPESEEGRNALLPDVENWPARQKQLEALKSIAAAKSAEAEAATEYAKPFQATLKQKTLDKNKVVKKVRAAEVAKTKAEARLARVEKWLAEAKKPNEIKNAEEAKTKATEALTAAQAQLAAANAAAQPAIDAHAKAAEEANTAEAARVATVNAAKEAERHAHLYGSRLCRRRQRGTMERRLARAPVRCCRRRRL
jgi:lipoprotein-anchoring transpeptidase ErfK/SrfK